MLDLEAGLENISRSTPRYADAILTVVEPYYRSMETSRPMCELARELGVKRTWAVANRVLLAEVPYDESLLAAERAGQAPIDHGADAPAVRAIRRLAGALPLE